MLPLDHCDLQSNVEVEVIRHRGCQKVTTACPNKKVVTVRSHKMVPYLSNMLKLKCTAAAVKYL